MNYTPPKEDLAIFDSLVFEDANNQYTLNQAKQRYVNYPLAQGTVGIPSATFSGNLNMSGNNITRLNTINPPPSVLFTSFLTDIELDSGVESSIFGQLTTTKNSKRYYSFEFPVALKMDISSSIDISTTSFNISNMVVKIYKNNVLFQTLTASANNILYGTNRNQSKTGVMLRGIGYQYYGQFSIPLTTDILTGSGTDIYTFTATPTFTIAYSHATWSAQAPKTVINTTTSNTFTPSTTPSGANATITYLSTSSTGFSALSVVSEAATETLVSKSFIRQELDTSIPSINGNYVTNYNAQKALNTFTQLPAITTWTLRKTPAGMFNFSGVVYSGKLNRIVAVSFESVANNIMTSDDGGITWTQRSKGGTNPTNALGNVKWFDNLNAFYATGSFGANTTKMYTSADGITWNQQTTPNQNDYNDIDYSPKQNRLVAVANSGTGRIIYSNNGGTNWLTATGTGIDGGGWQRVLWINDWQRWVAIAGSTGSTGNQGAWSSDGINWTTYALPQNSNWLTMVYSSDHGYIVAGALTGTSRSMISKDGINWTLASASSLQVRGMVYVPEYKLFISANFQSSTLVSSLDGLNWTTINITANRNWRTVCWCKELGTLVMVARDNILDQCVLTSSLAYTYGISKSFFDNNFYSSGINGANGIWYLNMRDLNCGTGAFTITGATGATGIVRTGSGGVSGQHLKVKVNGTEYRIELDLN